MSISCMIIDDEPLARKGLREYISDVDFLQLDSEFDSAARAIDRLNSGAVQLLFLDIQMPKLNGIELLRSLPHPPLVIITTAYSEFALEGYELDVLDYLVKPIPFQRFLKAAAKAQEYLLSKKQADAGHIFIKTEGKLVRIQLAELLFVEASQNYVTLHTPGKKYISHLTFKSIEENLPATGFLKIHKSYIVNLAKIDGIDSAGVIIGGHTLPISRANREQILESILQGKLLKR